MLYADFYNDSGCFLGRNTINEMMEFIQNNLVYQGDVIRFVEREPDNKTMIGTVLTNLNNRGIL